MTFVAWLALGCAEPDVQDAASSDTGVLEVPPDCAPGSRNGSTSGSDDRRTRAGTRYTVRVPDAYDPTVAHPLVVVYAPAGGDPEITETFTGLTPVLLAAGYLVAYADHRSPTSDAVFEDLGSIPRRIAHRWCVDEARVHFTGHSDGGSVATVLAVFPDFASIPAASIAPSAAGTGGDWFAAQTCPPPLPVMVMHSSRDTLFPGFGAEAAAWWGSCGGCGPDPAPPDRRGCAAYRNCDGDIEVTYCENTGSHGTWPAINHAIASFFDASVASGGIE